MSVVKFKPEDTVERLTLKLRFRRMYGRDKTVPFWVWSCECVCGNHREVREDHLRTKKIRSCGCLNNETRGASQRTHGESGKHTSSEYRTWCGMRHRCHCIDDDAYPRYGGRGIFVCKRWLGRNGFKNFLNDMGRKPSDAHSIERTDNDGPYAPWNCVWATNREQNRNTRAVKKLTYKGKTKLLVEWAEELGLVAGTVHGRLYAGWSVEEALETPTTDRWARRRGKFINNGRGW